MATRSSHRQRKEYRQSFTPGSSWVRPPPRRKLDAASSSARLIDHKSVDLTPGFDIPVTALTVVLDALRSDGRRKVDVGDIKLIVSQLGSRITQLGGLDDETRRYAEAALYKEILWRCITI
jgi:hypothetical protein